MSLDEWLEIPRREMQIKVGTSENCIVEGCSEPFYKNFALCEAHLREFRNWKEMKKA